MTELERFENYQVSWIRAAAAGKGFNEWLCSLLQPLPLRFMKHHNFSKRSNSFIFGPTEDPKKRKMIRIWCPRWWAHQFESSCNGVVTRGLYSDPKLTKNSKTFFALVNRKDPFSIKNLVHYSLYWYIRARKFNGTDKIPELISPRTTLVYTHQERLFRRKLIVNFLVFERGARP